MDELLKRVLSDMGKTQEQFDAEVELLKETSEITKLQNQNSNANLQIIELWETLIVAGVI